MTSEGLKTFDNYPLTRLKKDEQPTQHMRPMDDLTDEFKKRQMVEEENAVLAARYYKMRERIEKLGKENADAELCRKRRP